MLAQLRFRVQMLAVDPTKKIGGKAGLELRTCPGLLGFYLGPYEREEGKVGLFG